MRGNNNHWKVLDDPKVHGVARKVARQVANNNKGFLEEDDLYQEALILIAGKPDLAEQATLQEYGPLHYALRMDLLDKFVRPLMRSGEMEQRKYKTVTTDDADDFAAPYVAFDAGTGDYNADAVKLLLPAVWDESYAYGLPDREDAPDKDMPKAAGHKARANSHWAYIADIKAAWKRTPLTNDERRALVLYFGMGMSQSDAGLIEGVNKSTVNRRLDSAVNKILAFLNGANMTQEETEID